MTTKTFETDNHGVLHLGMKLVDERPAFKFGRVFSLADLPAPPAAFCNETPPLAEGNMLGNDRVGCCFWSGRGYAEMLASRAAGGTVRVTTQDVLDDYADATGWRVGVDNSDQGTDPNQGMSWLRKTGLRDSAVQRHKIDAYMDADPGHRATVMLAAWYLGSCGWGFAFPDYASQQFDRGQPWDYVPGQPAPTSGHWVEVVGQNSRGMWLVRTWGRVHAMTDQFAQKYGNICLPAVNLDLLNAQGLTPRQFDQARLQAALGELS